MRDFLAAFLLCACSSSSSPMDPHELGTCDLPAWDAIDKGAYARNVQCEAGCRTPPKMPGSSCNALPNDAGYSTGLCGPSATFDGMTGCCMFVDDCPTDAGITLPCRIVFAECR